MKLYGSISLFCRWNIVLCASTHSALITFSFVFNTLRPRQNGRRFADDTFKRIYLNENVRISIKISMKFVPMSPINNNSSLVQIMAWRRSGDKPVSKPMMVSLLTHICVTRPQWVNSQMRRPCSTSQDSSSIVAFVLFCEFKTCVCVPGIPNRLVNSQCWPIEKQNSTSLGYRCTPSKPCSANNMSIHVALGIWVNSQWCYNKWYSWYTTFWREKKFIYSRFLYMYSLGPILANKHSSSRWCCQEEVDRENNKCKENYTVLDTFISTCAIPSLVFMWNVNC